MKILFYILFLVLIPFNSSWSENGQYTGKALFNGLDAYLNMSESAPPDIDGIIDISWSQSYISGTWEMGLVQYGHYREHPEVKPLYCPPMDIVMPNSELAMIIYSFLKQHPQYHDKGALELIATAFIKTFPCTEKQ